MREGLGDAEGEEVSDASAVGLGHADGGDTQAIEAGVEGREVGVRSSRLRWTSSRCVGLAGGGGSDGEDGDDAGVEEAFAEDAEHN